MTFVLTHWRHFTSMFVMVGNSPGTFTVHVRDDFENLYRENFHVYSREKSLTHVEANCFVSCKILLHSSDQFFSYHPLSVSHSGSTFKMAESIWTTNIKTERLWMTVFAFFHVLYHSHHTNKWKQTQLSLHFKKKFFIDQYDKCANFSEKSKFMVFLKSH